MCFPLSINNLIDDKKCYDEVRRIRWDGEPCCPKCKSQNIIKRGKHNSKDYCQRYECKDCLKRFDDLTDTVFSGHHQPLKTWIIFSYFMGLNLSTLQISQEIGLNKNDAHEMAEVLRKGIVDKKPEPFLSQEVECDEVYVVAGHKGQPAKVKKKEERDVGID